MARRRQHGPQHDDHSIELSARRECGSTTTFCGCGGQLPDELECDFLLSQRGVLNLAHTEQEVRDSRRRFANQLNEVDAEWVVSEEIAEFCPILNTSQDVRYPALGATLQRRAGTAEHDHVTRVLARKADEMGVDFIQNCEVTGFLTEGDRVTCVRTSRGPISAWRVGLTVAVHTSLLTDTLGFRVPVQSHPLQVLVFELLESIHPCVVMSNHMHGYCSQARKGELVLDAGSIRITDTVVRTPREAIVSSWSVCFL